MFTNVKKVTGESKKDYLYRVIKEAIMSLTMLPGQALRETELGKAFCMSRTPIREVMIKLKEEHLVEVIPQVGTYVSKIKPKLIEEAAFMHFTLAKEILFLSCKSFPQESLHKLKKNLTFREMLLQQKGKVPELWKLNNHFHYIIFQGNQRENVWSAINRIGLHYNRMKVLSNMDDYQHIISQHKNIITIIENKEVDQIENVLTTYIMEPIYIWRTLYNNESPYISYFDFT